MTVCLCPLCPNQDFPSTVDLCSKHLKQYHTKGYIKIEVLDCIGLLIPKNTPKHLLLLDAEQVWLTKCSMTLKSGYPVICRKYKQYFKGEPIHNIVLERPSNKALVVDHINGDTLDARKSNLRLVEHSLNNLNRHKITNSTGVTGITYRQKQDRYEATIKYKGKRYYLGSSKTKEQASKIRSTAHKALMEAIISKEIENIPDLKIWFSEKTKTF